MFKEAEKSVSPEDQAEGFLRYEVKVRETVRGGKPSGKPEQVAVFKGMWGEFSLNRQELQDRIERERRWGRPVEQEELALKNWPQEGE